mgnify:CR=1 FL=1
MFCSDKQVGRSRVNNIRDRKHLPKGKILYPDDGFVQLKPRGGLASYKPREKQKGQLRDKTMSGMDKLFRLQNELIKEGLTMNKYTDYVQDKINNDKYYYKFLNDEKIAQLNKVYHSKLQVKKTQRDSIIDKNELNKKQRSNYRNKKSIIINEQKQKLINDFVKELNRTDAIGISNKIKSDITPSNFNIMKYYFFTGGRYLESQDKKWAGIYSKLVSGVSAHLFNKHSNTEMNNLIHKIP